MRLVMMLLSALVALAALATVAFLLLGPERIWGVFGPADLGAVDFQRLERRGTPNDALACPAGMCGDARVDLVPPVFAADARSLRAALAKVIAAEPKVVRVAADDAGGTERFVQRSALLGYPDTIVVRYVDLPGGRSTLALYSRAQIGRSDLGANKARLERWLARLADAVPRAS
jgi:uncharacterized protein (DUF1499 family)